MKLQMVGCSHHTATVAVRERLAFSPAQTRDALDRLNADWPGIEAVILSTCNRVELYVAGGDETVLPTHRELVAFLADFHRLPPQEIGEAVGEKSGESAVRHLFTVASSLDSMVVGEAQILAQVKQAFELARAADRTGPTTHAVFQAALHVAKRVATETAINQRRVSVPSVAVADFARQIFETFEDKRVLVIGAGEMGEETVRYLIDEGAREIAVVNRTRERAAELAARVGGADKPWEQLDQLLIDADLLIGTTGASEPIVSVERFRHVHQSRHQRPLFVLDLAVPRDFEPGIGDFLGVYLYAIDDLKSACEANRRAREKEWPRAEKIVAAETARFVAEWNHRATGPTIQRLKAQAQQVKSDELRRLMNRLKELDPRSREEIERSFERLVNKLLHPPLESLRNEAERGAPQGLVDALRRLFQLPD